MNIHDNVSDPYLLPPELHKTRVDCFDISYSSRQDTEIKAYDGITL